MIYWIMNLLFNEDHTDYLYWLSQEDVLPVRHQAGYLRYVKRGNSPPAGEFPWQENRNERLNRVSPSLTLNYENRLVVDLIPFSILQSMFVTFFGVLQQRIADVSS